MSAAMLTAPCARRRRPAEPARGFTLVEVLVALAVLAIALAAVMRVLAQAIDGGAGLRDRMLALWVAEERAAVHTLERRWPSIDTTEGDITLFDREWRYREKVSATPVPAMRRIDIDVRARGTEDSLARLTIFLQQP